MLLLVVCGWATVHADNKECHLKGYSHFWGFDTSPMSNTQPGVDSLSCRTFNTFRPSQRLGGDSNSTITIRGAGSRTRTQIRALDLDGRGALIASDLPIH